MSLDIDAIDIRVIHESHEGLPSFEQTDLLCPQGPLFLEGEIGSAAQFLKLFVDRQQRFCHATAGGTGLATTVTGRFISSLSLGFTARVIAAADPRFPLVDHPIGRITLPRGFATRSPRGLCYASGVTLLA